MTLLVTGGAGYIGAQTVWAARDAGLDVVVVDDLSTGVPENLPRGVPLVEADVTDRPAMAALLRRHRVDAMLHFAARVVAPASVADPLDYYRVNVGGLVATLEACAQAGVARWVFSSSAAVYGDVSEVACETSATEPASPYGRTKLMGEAVLADAARSVGARAAALRYFNVAGADPEGRTGQSTPRATHLVKLAARAAVDGGASVTIHGDDWPTADGTGVRDYIHVADVARAHLLALRRLDQEPDGSTLIVNLGSGSGASVRQILDAVGRASGAALAAHVGPRRAGDVSTLVAEASLARQVLGWKPEFDLDHMARHALSWERRLSSASERLAAAGD